MATRVVRIRIDREQLKKLIVGVLNDPDQVPEERRVEFFIDRAARVLEECVSFVIDDEPPAA